MGDFSLDIVVAGYIINKSKVLLIHHKKLNKWLPVGGHIEKNETPDEAVIREIREEVGLDVELVPFPAPRRGNQREHALPFYVNRHRIGENHAHYCLYYLAKPLNNAVVPKKDEILGYKWFGEDELESAEPKIDEGGIITCKEAIKKLKNFNDKIFD